MNKDVVEGKSMKVRTKLNSIQNETPIKAEKLRALQLIVEKYALNREAVVSIIAKTIKASLTEDKLKVFFTFTLTLGIIAQTQGFCDDKGSALDTVTKNVTDIIFSVGIKRAILGLAGAWGLFQAVSTGSFKPLLLWGGIGLAIAYVPKLIEIIANVG